MIILVGQYPGRSLLVPRPKSSLVHCSKPSLSSTVQGITTLIRFIVIVNCIVALNRLPQNLLASDGCDICGLAKELLLPATASMDHQQSKKQHNDGLAHVVTDSEEIGRAQPFEVTLLTLFLPQLNFSHVSMFW